MRLRARTEIGDISISGRLRPEFSTCALPGPLQLSKRSFSSDRCFFGWRRNVGNEQPQAMNGTAARCIGIDHARWIRPGPRPVVARQRPEVAGFGPATSRIQYRRRRFIDTKLRGGEPSRADDATGASAPGRHSRPRRQAWNGRARYRASPASGPDDRAANATDT
jgi:hypothetical protein